ncbi:PTS sorbitol transporter [Klebsiella pneumoniae]|nr:PTS sorbitol transporter [Klebsiella pneumoniae]
MIFSPPQMTAIGRFVAGGPTDKMLLPFDSNGPKDCLDYSLSLEPSFREESLMILPGDRLLLTGHDYLITAVGKGAQQALFELSHLTLVFNGDLNPCHVGAVHLSGPVPKLHDLHGNLVIEEGRP